MNYKKIKSMLQAHSYAISINNDAQRKEVVDFFVNKFGFMAMPYKYYEVVKNE